MITESFLFYFSLTARQFPSTSLGFSCVVVAVVSMLCLPLFRGFLAALAFHFDSPSRRGELGRTIEGFSADFVLLARFHFMAAFSLYLVTDISFALPSHFYFALQMILPSNSSTRICSPFGFFFLFPTSSKKFIFIC